MRFVLAAAVVLLAVAAPRLAEAKECRNVCQVGDGDLCAELRQQVADVGAPLRLRATRQRGTCGGGEVLAAGDVALTWSRSPAGPFTAVPATTDGAELVFTADHAGPYFLQLAARDGRGRADRFVVLAIDARDATRAPVAVRFKLRPPRGLSLARIALRVRAVPAGVDDTFPPARWPTWRANDIAGKSARPLRLPPGRYQLEWTHRHRTRPQSGVETVEVTTAGPLAVPLHVAAH